MPFGLTPAELAQLVISGGSGIAGAIGAGNQQNLSQQQLARQQQLAALLNQQTVEQDLATQRQNRAQQFASGSPLGSEQQYAMQQALRSAILPALQNRPISGPTNPDIASRFTPQSNPLQGMDFSRLQQTLSPDATARAITDRRTALAGVDPVAAGHYRPLTDYGLDPTGAFNAETQFRSEQGQNQLDEESSKLRQLAQQQYNMTEQQAQQLEQKHGSSIWKKLGSIGLIAGGAIATALTGGAASPALAAAIGAGTGAGAGALSGGGKGALLGALTGGVTGGLGAMGGGAASAAANGAGSTGRTIANSLLNPQTLAQMTGAGVGGNIGQAIQLGSNFLPRNGFFQGSGYQTGKPPAGTTGDYADAEMQGGATMNRPPFQPGLPPQLQTQLQSGPAEWQGPVQQSRPNPMAATGPRRLQGPGLGASMMMPSHGGPPPQFNVERPQYPGDGVRDDRGLVPQVNGKLPEGYANPAIPWWLMPTGMGSGALQGTVMEPAQLGAGAARAGGQGARQLTGGGNQTGIADIIQRAIGGGRGMQIAGQNRPMLGPGQLQLPAGPGTPPIASPPGVPPGFGSMNRATTRPPAVTPQGQVPGVQNNQIAQLLEQLLMQLRGGAK